MSAVPQAEEPVLIREDRDGICTLTMNRPKQMNLLTSEMIAALQGALDAIAQEKDVHVVVLAGAGKGFCAGHDLKEIRALGEKQQDRGAVPAMRAHDAVDPAAAAAGDRARAGRGGRRGLPAGRAMRPGGGLGRREVHHAGRDLGLLLLDARRCRGAQPAPQARDGDAAHGRPDRRRARAGVGTGQSSGCRRRRSTKRWANSRASSLPSHGPRSPKASVRSTSRWT